MTIKKFLHSCILVEENGKRLLIDPGEFSFLENRISAKDIGGVDVILITHSHADHFYPKAIKELLEYQPAVVFSHGEVVELAEKENIGCERIMEGEVKTVAGFTIEGIHAPHGPAPTTPPYNLGYKINNIFLHPGDCVSIEGINADVLALPVTGSWLRMAEAIEFAKRVKPSKVIPIHDAFIKDIFIDRFRSIQQKYLGEIGAYPLDLGMELQV